MPLFIHKKEKHIVELIKKHADQVVETVGLIRQAIDLYLDGDKEESKKYTKMVHKAEEKADIIEREVDKEMFEGAFMPSIREVLYVALDFVDKVANRAEKTGDFLTLIHPVIPDEIREDVKKMGALTYECAEKLRDCVYHLFDDVKKVYEDSVKVESLEGEVDKYAWKVLETIFEKLDIKKFSERMMLREMVIHISSMSNKMEDASDKIDIISLKMRL